MSKASRGDCFTAFGGVTIPAHLRFMDCGTVARSEIGMLSPVIEVAGADNPSIVKAVREGNPKQNDKHPKERRKLELVSSTIPSDQAIFVGQRIRDLLLAAHKAAPVARPS